MTLNIEPHVEVLEPTPGVHYLRNIKFVPFIFVISSASFPRYDDTSLQDRGISPGGICLTEDFEPM